MRKKDSRCKSLTRVGEPCRAAATAGGLCFFHTNPNKVSELGRMGGRTKRGLLAEVIEPLPKLDKVSAVRDLVDKLIAEVYEGKITTRVAGSLAPLLNLQLRVVETGLEARIATLEKSLARLQADADNRHDMSADSSDESSLPRI